MGIYTFTYGDGRTIQARFSYTYKQIDGEVRCKAASEGFAPLPAYPTAAMWDGAGRSPPILPRPRRHAFLDGRQYVAVHTCC
jgi:hypothetical protein